MGPFVTIFDLICALAVLASAGCLLTAALMALCGRAPRALRILRVWATGAALYFTVLLAVSFAQPQQVLQVGELRCWDDWCLTVQNVQRSVENGRARYNVALRLLSRAGRVNQRALDAAVYLIDDLGRRYDPLPDAAQIPLSVLLHPAESVDTSRVFVLPEEAHQVGLITNHGTGPGNFIIGDEASFFHKRTIVRFP
jgi:hypothetical protein